MLDAPVSYAEFIKGKDLALDPAVESVGVGREYLPQRLHSTELQWEVVREMTEADLPRLSDPLPAQPAPTIKSLRASHHHIARLVSLGTHPAEISAITGYSTATIKSLEDNPAFQELLAYYGGIAEVAHADVLEQTKSLGLSMVAEMQRRLDEEPEKVTNQQLLDGIDRLIARPFVAAQQAQAAASSASRGADINIRFVQARGAFAEGEVVEAEIISERPLA